jgi:argininosuccinate lyase
LAKSSEYVDAVAPGFTHLQHAQPVSFGHELAKHSCALERDLGRIKDWYERSNLSPLGAGALAGSSLPISPEQTARDLGFDGVVRNSIDAVSDRDFAVEALFALALIGVHVSRIGEEWTIWCTSEFGWAKLDDAYATGSSIMPQKKNPDVAELARGKSGPLIGNLTSLLTTMKAMPFAYNRDLQEDKEVVFNSIENLLTLLPALTGMVASTNFDRKRMAKSAPEGFSLATEIADYLVRKGIPFSKAHEAAGKCVKLAEKSGVQLHELSATQLKSAHEQLDEGVRKFLDVKGAIASRDSVNGTAPKSVARQIRALGDSLKRDEKWISNESKRFSGMMSQ